MELQRVRLDNTMQDTCLHAHIDMMSCGSTVATAVKAQMRLSPEGTGAFDNRETIRHKSPMTSIITENNQL